jgi:hypothetical protein
VSFAVPIALRSSRGCWTKSTLVRDGRRDMCAQMHTDVGRSQRVQFDRGTNESSTRAPYGRGAKKGTSAYTLPCSRSCASSPSRGRLADRVAWRARCRGTRRGLERARRSARFPCAALFRRQFGHFPASRAASLPWPPSHARDEDGPQPWELPLAGEAPTRETTPLAARRCASSTTRTSSS